VHADKPVGLVAIAVHPGLEVRDYVAIIATRHHLVLSYAGSKARHGLRSWSQLHKACFFHASAMAAAFRSYEVVKVLHGQ